MTVMALPGFEDGHREGQQEGADLAVKAMFSARTASMGAGDLVLARKTTALKSVTSAQKMATTTRQTATTAQKTARKTGIKERKLKLLSF